MRSLLSLSILQASMEAPTMQGAMELEKRYVLALFLSISTTSLEEAMKPPEAPPMALPKVEEMKSIFPSRPKYSGVPLPVLPMKPAAWHQSIQTQALYFCANSQILSRGVISPSMLNTPSVTMTLILCSWVALSCSSRSVMSICLYLDFLALQSLIPSMIEAWLSVSLIIASSGPKMAQKKPALASNPLGKRIVSPTLQQSAMVFSNCLWMF